MSRDELLVDSRGLTRLDRAADALTIDFADGPVGTAPWDADLRCFRGTRHAICLAVGLLERRRGNGVAVLDRRRSYVDVVERVMGNSLTPDLDERPSTRVTNFKLAYAGMGGTCISSAVRISVLDYIPTAEKEPGSDDDSD